MAIRKLPPLLVNQIAAGEVIERPASVVKELVENSLDAGATRIDVVVEDGGKQLIRISDDGAGIPEAELELAITPHATSKLTVSEDLGRIGSFGFRGEALASIASVSRLRITSRSTDMGVIAESAATIACEGDQIDPIRPAAGSPGTVIEVRNIFFNTPARRKFLRAASSEMGHISDIVSRMAMANSHVSFSLRHNDRLHFEYPAEETARRRAVAVLGKDLDEALLEFDHEDDRATGGSGGSGALGDGGARVWGLAGLPSIAKATSKFQHLCVNGRPIRDRSLQHAIREAYRGLIPPDRHPMAVLLIQIDPASVDVNVHPAKTEVRFHNAQRVHGLVLHSLRQRLLAADLTPQVMFRPSAAGVMTPVEPAFAAQGAPNGSPIASPQSQSESSMPRPAWAAPLEARHGHGNHEASNDDGRQTDAASTATGMHAFVDYFRQMAPSQKGFVYQQVREAMAEDQPGSVGESGVNANAATDADSAGAWAAAGANAVRQDADERLPPVLRAQGVLQVHESYLVTQDDDGLIIVDQHALHERVMFEDLRRRVLSQSLESQRLLMPAIVEHSARCAGLLDQLRPVLDRIGVEAELMGPATVAVHAFPSLLFERKVDPAEFMRELLDRADEGEFDFDAADRQEAALHEVLDMMACKAAVKAGDRLTPEELADLLARRKDIERASNCPHGRPTTIRLSLKDLERQFGRS